MTLNDLPSDVLDIDDPSTWHLDIQYAVDACIEDWPDVAGAEYVEEVVLPLEGRILIEEALGDSRIVAYHATRLLPEEVVRILDEGLVPLSRDLLEARLAAAVGCGAISARLAADLLEATGPTLAERHRIGQVCLASSRNSLKVKHYFHHLFNIWGGEALRNHLRTDESGVRSLREIGAPAVVPVALTSEDWKFCDINPDVARDLCAVRLGLEPHGVVRVASVQPEAVLEVVLEGSEAWTRLAPMSQP